jgi:hypothetical protein
MEAHADDSPGWGGKFNFEKIASRRKPLEEPEDDVTRLDAVALMSRKFAETRQIVDGLFPAGCVLLVGPPKQGKSWLSLQLARCVDAGVPFMGRKTVQGDVLYLALEDGFRRLQSRLEKQSIKGNPRFTRGLTFQIEIATAEKGGLSEIEAWLDGHPNAALVIVDVLKMFREPRKGKVDPYERDYADVRPLTALATRYGVCIIVVHHTNKGSAAATDPFDRVSGTGGLSGAADGTMLLVPDESGSLGLYGRGRDFPEIEIPVSFNPDECVWEVAVAVPDNRYGELSTRIIERLRYENGNAVGPKDIALSLTESETEVSKRLGGLVRSRRVTKLGRGKYVLAGLEPKTG